MNKNINYVKKKKKKRLKMYVIWPLCDIKELWMLLNSWNINSEIY